ncbi:DNA internalization-related competence protein ComEC/Rec2 [Peribacillus sp. SCS-37]|uniref:DNA internalization-related competence protein ComEC/Rec2 n=1 Tax=Paraperibacillus esterisolvens TaxID=3115296 RepID=UPI00390613FD
MNLILSALTAAAAGGAWSLAGWKAACCGAAYLSFLFWKRTPKTAAIQTGIFILFTMNNLVHDSFNKSTLDPAGQTFILIFSEIPFIDGNSLTTAARTKSGETILVKKRLQTLLEKKGLEESYTIGMECTVSGRLEKPDPSRNPHSFDYQKYLRHQGIHWILRVQEFQSCAPKRQGLTDRLSQARYEGIRSVERHFSREGSGIAAALLFGEDRLIHEEITNLYRKLGIVHLLSISGLHVALLTGALFIGGLRAGLTRNQMSIILMILLPAYAVMTGMSPPVVRACGMAGIFFLAGLLGFHLSGLQTLSLAFLTMLALQPYSLFDAGFQLSFTVTAALFLSVSILSYGKHVLKESFLISLISLLSSLPIMLHHFYEVSIAGLWMNLLFVPLFSFVALPLAIAAFSAFLIHPVLSGGFIFLFDQLVKWVNIVLEKASAFPMAAVVIGKPSCIAISILSLLIFLVFNYWEQRKVQKVKRALVLLFLLLGFQYFNEYVNPYGEIVFLDVGLGDSIFIRLPMGRGTYLIDTGGQMTFSEEKWMEKGRDFDPGKDIVVPFLKAEGITSLDKLILTHPDQDHIGGAAAVLKEIKVGQLMITGGAVEGYEELSRDFPRIKASAVTEGTGWMEGRDQFQIVSASGEEGNTNEASIVIYAAIGGKRWLFTGDLGKSGEEGLLRRYPSMRADVLKAGHHGSRHSSAPAFIKKLGAEITILSSGRNNRYGHPHQDVLDILNRENMVILRTDTHGAISYKFFRGKGTFSVMLP